MPNPSLDLRVQRSHSASLNPFENYSSMKRSSKLSEIMAGMSATEHNATSKYAILEVILRQDP
jgi:hypothetical protein